MDELAKDEDDRELSAIADGLLAIDSTQYESEAAIFLYSRLKEEIFTVVADQLYDEGYDLYSSNKYEEALEILLKAYALNPNDVNAIYFIGRSYHRLRDYENATLYYTIITTDFADTNRYSQAMDRLSEIPAQD